MYSNFCRQLQSSHFASYSILYLGAFNSTALARIYGWLDETTTAYSVVHNRRLAFARRGTSTPQLCASHGQSATCAFHDHMFSSHACVSFAPRQSRLCRCPTWPKRSCSNLSLDHHTQCSCTFVNLDSYNCCSQQTSESLSSHCSLSPLPLRLEAYLTACACQHRLHSHASLRAQQQWRVELH